MRVTINNESTTTEPPPKNGHQPKPLGDLNVFSGTKSSKSKSMQADEGREDPSTTISWPSSADDDCPTLNAALVHVAL